MFFDRPDSGERAVLVHLNLASETEREDPREFEELVLSAGGDPVAFVMGSRDVPDSRTFVGSGKLQEIAAAVAEHEAQIVMFNHSLSPSQERNLEKELQCRVLDRTGLILDIFAQRARTHEGKLQVELARLQYLSTRLVRRWSHLERQRGGIGTRGGPGETQIELDRRMIGDHIKRTKERLLKVKRQRQTQRRQRQRRDTFAISLVGYTNAGKTSLFNALVNARAYAADQLFATLDTTTRHLYLGEASRSVSLSDTVGFIRNLPHGLIDAFEATLQEAVDADLLLHVVDASNPNHQEQMDEVARVLREIGAADVRQILVFNKLDAMEPGRRPLQMQDRIGFGGNAVDRVFVSARTGEGIAQLRDLLAQAASTGAQSDQAHGISPDAAEAVVQLGTIER